MSVKYTIDNEKIELLLENNFSIGEVVSSTQKALNKTTSPLPILVDVSHSAELKSVEELEKFVDFLNQNKDKIVPRLAIVVAQPVRYGTGRQIGVYLETAGIESKPFYDRNQALAWLFGK
jgi:hypothetical protein